MPARFYAPDPNPGIKLSALPLSSSRLRSWLARAIDLPAFPFAQEVQVRGAIHVVAGLEYHNKQFMAGVAAIPYLSHRDPNPTVLGQPARLPSPEEFEALADLHHEAIAYINRSGQLYYFGQAMGLQHLLPEVVALLPFRHKHTAHRSIDKPRAEPKHEQESQAMAFGFSHFITGGFPVFQLRSGEEWCTFHMGATHPKLLAEAVTMFTAIHPLPNDA